MAEASAGKDSVTGHWEMMGIVLDRPFPVFPDGFSAGRSSPSSRAGPAAACSATRRRRARQIIDELGAEHMRTGALIVYTSADSVFQIAAHEDVVPVPELYRACEIAYELVGEGLGVGRVIARPFVGAPGAFTRTANRHDYALPPPGETLLDRADGGGAAGRRHRQDRGSVRRPRHHRARSTRPATTTGWIASSGRWRAVDRGLHLRQPRRLRHAVRPSQRRRRLRARTSSGSTRGWRGLLPRLRDDDLLVVTADHGNDPTTPSTDHSREYVPLLVAGAARARAASISARARRSPISGRRSPRSSASGRSRTAPAFCSEICV